MRRFIEQEYCLVIMDIVLAEADGRELLKVMRRAKTIPILVLSSKVGAENRISAYQAGAHAYLEKPYELEECLAQAEALMELYVGLKPQKERCYTLVFGVDLVIDPDRRKVLLKGKPLNLTRKEFELLFCLASHAGQVLSREQLYGMVWNGEKSYNIDEIVKGHIKALRKKGIAVHFETENINTLESSGELLLAILSSQAQEESHSISTNVTWGIVRKFEKGEMMLNVNNILGFTRDGEGNIVVDQAEAAVVRKIFYLHLCGDSLTQIKEKLEAEGIKTVRGKDTGRVSTIDHLLSNEKYMGDALLQKSYTVDFLTKKRNANTGQRKQYYVENSHEAIIPKSIFYQVQAEKARRAGLVKKTTKKSKTAKGIYSSKYALTELLVCGECGTHYRRTTWNNTKKGEKKIVWRCINRLEHGKKICKESPTLTEESLQMAIAKGLADIMYGEDELQFREELKQDVLCTLADMYGGTTPEELDQSIKALQEQLLYYAGLAARDASG